MRRAVFLDRDGVLNQPIIRDHRPYPPANIQETVIPEDVEPSLVRLKSRGFLLLVVTNQPDVGRGKSSRDDVEQINRFLSARLPLDDFFVCYHDDADECSCRKPLPGLLHFAAAAYDLSLGTSYLIGDRWRDIDAGAAAGCRTILIDHDYHERRAITSPDVAVASIAEAVDWILAKEGE